MSKEELLSMVKTLALSDHINPYIKMSVNDWETLGRPEELCGKKILPVAGLPDGRMYTSGDD